MTSAKFGNDALTEALWMITLDSGQDEEAGTVDDIGWHALIHIEENDKVNIDAPNEHYVDVPRGTYIVASDSNGFVYRESYEYRSDEATKAWQSVLDAEEELYDDEHYGYGVPIGDDIPEFLAAE